MKKYFFIAGVAHEGKDGQYAKANEVFDIQAGKDGLWLHTPQINGVKHSINLLQHDETRLKQMLESLWCELRGITRQ